MGLLVDFSTCWDGSLKVLVAEDIDAVLLVVLDVLHFLRLAYQFCTISYIMGSKSLENGILPLF